MKEPFFYGSDQWPPPTKIPMNEDIPYWKQCIIKCAKEYIVANHAHRTNSSSWSSVGPDPNSPEGIEYKRVNDLYTQAYYALWDACDMEYNDKEPVIMAAWNWRYWTVMARKCCHWQKSILTNYRAARTMSRLDEAEAHLMKLCGLEDIYRSPRSYIEEKFPKFKGG